MRKFDKKLVFYAFWLKKIHTKLKNEGNLEKEDMISYYCGQANNNNEI